MAPISACSSASPGKGCRHFVLYLAVRLLGVVTMILHKDALRQIAKTVTFER
jgi:hypothetical protein